MLHLSLDNNQFGWRALLVMGDQIVWSDTNTYDTSAQARTAGNEYVLTVFRALFAIAPADYSPILDMLKSVDPEKLEKEALERETFGGKSFTENLLDIIIERCTSAA